MNKQLIFLGSMTKTMRARDLLRKYGIKSKVERKIDDDKLSGCGFGIIVVSGDTELAKEILFENGFIAANNE